MSIVLSAGMGSLCKLKVWPCEFLINVVMCYFDNAGIGMFVSELYKTKQR